MLDSSCSRLTSPRLVSILANAGALESPALIALLLLGLVGLVFLIRFLLPLNRLGKSKTVRPSSRKYQIARVVAFLLLIYLAVTLLPTFAAVRFGLVGSIPDDPGTHVDAIVILGRGKPYRPSRVEVAAELWKANRAPTIFISGNVDAPLMISLLETKGVPSQVLAGENCSDSTEENALFTARLLQPQGRKQILLVTDPPHMLRSLLTFRSLGFTVIPHPSPLPQTLSPHEKDALMLREYSALFFYSLLGWFLPQNYYNSVLYDRDIF